MAAMLMIESREQLSFTFEPGQLIGIAGEEVGQDLEATSRPSRRGRETLLPCHRRREGRRFRRAQFRTGGERHSDALWRVILLVGRLTVRRRHPTAPGIAPVSEGLNHVAAPCNVSEPPCWTVVGC
jgi:hypothetical protein